MYKRQGGIAAAIGFVVCAGLTVQWSRSGFGALDPEIAMRQIIPGVALMLIGTQSLLASIFFAALRSAFDSSRHVSGREAKSARWREISE